MISLAARNLNRTLTGAVALIVVFTSAQPGLAAPPKFTPTERGVLVETDRYRASIQDGALVNLVNKLTGEEYLNGAEAMTPIVSHLPGGLGSQAGDDALAVSSRLYTWPWQEHPSDLQLPNHRTATTKSGFTLKTIDEASVALVYTGLSDGKKSFEGESFEMQVAVEAVTGDLLLTPLATSPTPGVFGANLTVAPTAMGVSVEAPIWGGMRLTSDMPPSMWHNKWPDFWDYAFLALNGSRRGAVGIWAQDPDLRYKNLVFMTLPDKEGIALSLGTMNTPPFDKLTQARGVTWRVQAFDTSWAQAAARFRDWRLKNVKIAPRPDWTRKVSFVNSGVNAEAGWLNTLSAYLNGEHLERTVTFAPVIRAAAFDTKHWDNTPYEKFKSQMPAWKNSGAKLMAYLQPMIMWGAAPADDKEAQRIVALHREANTNSVFQKVPRVITSVDQHHLGHPGWQELFLGTVKSYIQEHDADGVYHDQSYPTPIDVRGPINGMNSVQGMADYFYKAAVQNPNSIHGTEHMQEANSVGASLGIGPGILWGPAPTMRRQRIEHASPVSNSLHSPNGAIWAFPHYSDFVTRGDATQFHWGMDQMERRGDLAGLALQNTGLYNGRVAPYDVWANEIKLDRVRALTFVRHGLRPAFPEKWERGVDTYFRGEAGEDFRYERMNWGSRLVRVADGQKTPLYGRAKGVTYAAGTGNGGGNVAGWVFYNDRGPSGLHPNRYYFLDPEVKRPATYFSPAFSVLPGVPLEPTFYESYVEDGFANEYFAMLKVQPLESVGRIITYDKVFLHTPSEPREVYVNGRTFKPRKTPEGTYQIDFRTPATICVVLKDAPASVEELKPTALGRVLSNVNLDVFDTAWVSGRIASKPVTMGEPAQPAASLMVPKFDDVGGVRGYQLHVPMRAPVAGTLKLQVREGASIKEIWVNGLPLDSLKDPKNAAPQVPFKAGETKVISLHTTKAPTVAYQWVAAAP